MRLFAGFGVLGSVDGRGDPKLHVLSYDAVGVHPIDFGEAVKPQRFFAGRSLQKILALAGNFTEVSCYVGVRHPWSLALYLADVPALTIPMVNAFCT